MTDTLAPPAATPIATDDNLARTGLGAARDRVDGVVKTSGAAEYSGDVPYADLAHAAVLHAPVSRARITSIDTSRAESAAGVVAVLTHLNAPRLKRKPRVPLDLATLMGAGTAVDYLNTDEVAFDGQPVALVVAESIEAAVWATSLIDVTYEVLEAAVDFASVMPEAKLQGGLPMPPTGGRKGDAVAALAASPVVVDHVFTTPWQNHNAIEPHTTTARWDGDHLTIHEGTQNMDWLQRVLASRFGVPAANIHVVSRYTGGAFGGKTSVWAGTFLAVMAARATGRAVRLALSREGVFRTVGGRAQSVQRVALGAQRDGRLTALIHQSVMPTGRVGGSGEQITSCSRDLYASPTMLLEQRTVGLDVLPNTVMRAPGESTGTFALETSIDELAYAVGVDPVEIRLRNQPHRAPLGRAEFSHHSMPELLRRGAERFGWAERDATPGSMRDGQSLVGWGVASAIHPAWTFPVAVTLTVRADGGVTVRCAMHEMGMGTVTAVTQIVEHCLGVPFESISVESGDSSLPTGAGAGGSGQTASMALGVIDACDRLAKALHDLARADPSSALHGTSRRTASVAAGAVHAGAGSQAFTSILARAGRSDLTVRHGSDAGIGAAMAQMRWMTGLIVDGRRWMKAASGAHFVEVRVDADTGETRVSRWLGVFDIGRVVNEKLAASQLRGGIVWGIGLALQEAALMDPRRGRIMNPGLAEYHVPVHADVPRIDIEMLGDSDPQMPLGILGAGEVGITGAGAAIANAIHHATGRRIRDLPITLDSLL